MNVTICFSAVKSTHLWLLVALLLGLGDTHDLSHNAETKGVHIASDRSLSPKTIANSTSILKPTFIRFRRASSAPFSCLAPPQPTNGEWKLHRDACVDDMDCTVPEGTSVPVGAQLNYRCKAGYELDPEGTVVFCRIKGTWSALPVCNEIKCRSLQSSSTTASCSNRHGEWVNCDSSVPPGTQAEIHCRNGYAKESSFTIRKAVVACTAEGTWEPDPVRCIPVCGQATASLTPLVIGGVAANVTEFPWHASLHLRLNPITQTKKVLKYICGATIIQTNFLLTAAHCVFDETTQTPTDPKKLYVITGNVHQEYDSPQHDPLIVQKATVRRVYTFCTYSGLAGNYAADIALIELHQPFELSGILHPACLDNSDNSDRILQSGVPGRISGFGRTAEGFTSSTLQTITVPYVPYSQCVQSNFPVQNAALISSDKFCAGLENRSVVCDGDSGGGLVFKKSGLWHVMGILNVGLAVDTSNGDRTCSRDAYSLYTRVSTYITWIKDVLYAADKKTQYPPCTNNISKKSFCLAPSQPANGEWRLHQDSCEADTNCKAPEGTRIPNHRVLKYSCTSGFKISGSTIVTCEESGQWSPIPVCTKLLGTSCSWTDSSPGTCTLLPDCESVLEQMSLGKAPNTICGYESDRKVPIVCCPTNWPTTSTGTTEHPNLPPPRGAIARQKCADYAKFVYTTKPSPFKDGRPVNVTECAIKSMPLIVGGIKAGRMEFPFMAAVGYNSESGGISWLCGGSLISDTFVLTTASCASSGFDRKATWARLGDLNLESSDDGAQPEDRRVIERITHPEHKLPAEYHDIALLRLESSVPFNGWIRPACLHTESSTGTKRAIATGWGLVDWAEEESSSKDLLKVSLPLVDAKTCDARYTTGTEDPKLPNGIVEDWMICAGEPGKDTCHGDNGGPLAIFSKKEYCMYEVIGLTSLGKLCGTSVPGVYTRVYNYVPWIESIVWPEL